ncbi:MAG: hypothetical protein K0Q50_1586 [Vampirovibrio sp.]|jgi:outer membrane biosynthesis protein TonB|nr:hypothetical protein [Vampirovibrio sp.]
MPTSGKPVFNPFTAAQTAQENAARSADLAGKPSRPTIRKPRGISGLAMDDRFETLPMRKATLFSVLAHLLSPVMLTALTLLIVLILSWILHFNFWDWFKPKPAKPDMVFTLVNDTHATRPDKPLFRGNFNQRAGGKRDPKQAVKAAEEPPKSSPAKQAEEAVKPVKPVKAEQPKPAETPTPPKPQEMKKPQAEKPVPQSQAKPAIAKPAKPDASQSKQAEPAKNATSASSAKAATQIASMGRPSSGASSATSTDANAQGGPAELSGVDVAEDVDFGPYMAEVTRRIKRNWQPLRSERSKKVVVEFYIARDGRLVNDQGETVELAANIADSVKVLKSSGDRDTDLAAIEAIRLSAPFKPLPPQEKADVVPINFTFDYNVLNPTSSNRASKR